MLDKTQHCIGIEADGSISEAVPAMPGLLMSLVTLIMLLLDIVISDKMVELQYAVYPALCRGVMIISFACLLFWLVTARTHRLRRYDKTTLLFAGFIFMMLVSTCVNGITREAMLSVPYRYVGVMDIIVFLTVYMGLSRQIHSDIIRNIILVTIMITADILCIAYIVDICIIDIPAMGSENVLSGIFFHDNHYGYYLTIAVAISAGYFIFGKSVLTFLGLASLLLNAAALAANRTAGCFLAAGATILIMILYALLKRRESARRVTLLCAITLLGAASALALSGEFRSDLALIFRDVIEIARGGDTFYAGHGRWRLWTITAGYIADLPILGYGCEGISGALLDYTGYSSSPHNEPLTYAAFFGIPAAVLYLGGCISAIAAGLRRSEDNSRVIAAFAALGYLISSAFGVAVFYTVPYLFILLGIASSNDAAG